MPSDFAFEVRKDGGVRVVLLQGQLDLASSGQVREALAAVGGETVVADLSGLEFLDSSGIAALLAARSDVLREGRSFQLRGASGIVRQVLELTGLASLLEPDDVEVGTPRTGAPSPR